MSVVVVAFFNTGDILKQRQIVDHVHMFGFDLVNIVELLLPRKVIQMKMLDVNVNCVIQVLPPVSSVEALVWCGNRLFSAGIDEFVYEHDVLTGSIKVDS